MSRPEILAPAGTREAFDAALAVGADAIYLGAEAFHARRGAKNFTRDDLPELVRLCHVRAAKLYLTLNTLMLEHETPALLSLAKAACAAGVDGAIVQDLGVAALLRQCAPDWPLHASTQMAVHNLAGVKALEEMGFSRVVLARECSGDEIEAICRGTAMQVEVFVHGALCMCVSGQCLMSSMLGARSGNRGLCAQPCRLPFASEASANALSLKDMSLIPVISRLEKMGVASLKIEGRMKRPEYVAAAVTACRDALEGRAPDMESLQSVFSRSGFTDGYFTAKRDFSMFGIRAKEDVQAAQGVLGKLSTLYTDTKRHVRPVAVKMHLSVTPEQVSLTVSDPAENSVTVTGEAPQIALNKPTDEGRARAALEKTGGTPFYLAELTCEIAEGLMVPASVLNEVRRGALAQLEEQRGRVHGYRFIMPADTPAQPADTPAHRPALRIDAACAAQVSESMAQRAQMIILPAQAILTLPPDSFLWRAPEKLCALLPRMLWDEARGRATAAKLRERGITHALIGNLGGMTIAKEAGLTIHASPFLNILNSAAAKEAAKLGAGDITLSYESALSCGTLRSPVPLGLTAYGHLPLMTVRNCPVRAAVGCARCKAGENELIDRKDTHLAMRCDRGSPELENPVPLYLADRLQELKGFAFLTLRFTRETPPQCEQIFEGYLAGKASPVAFTRGLLYKALL